MGFYYTIMRRLDLVYVYAQGDLLPRELKACVKGYMHDPNFHRGIDVLLEVSAGASVRFNDETGFENLHHMVKRRRTDAAYRIACATEDEEVCEVFLAILEESPVNVEAASFDTAVEALRWLGVSERHGDKEVLLEEIRAKAIPEETR